MNMKKNKNIKAKIYVNGDIENKQVFLTSGFQAPFQEKDLIKQIDVNSFFQSYASGGPILHLFTTEEMTPKQQEHLIMSIIKNFPIQYISKTPIMSICNSCKKKIVGKVNTCPYCESDDVTIWCRPVGYYRPVMRTKIDNDFDNAEYTFWLSGRIKDFSTRKNVSYEDVENIEKRVNEVVNNGY